MMNKEGIPNNWEIRNIEDVVKKAKNGGTPKKSEEKYWDGTIDWVNSGEVRGKYTQSAEASITKQGLEETSSKMFPKNSVLIAMYGGEGTVGRSTIVSEPISGNQAICCLVIDENIATVEFFYYYTMLLRKRLEQLARGASQNNINQSIILQQKIPIPPLAEQTEIVEKLKSRLERINRLNQSVQTVRQLSSEYENSIITYTLGDKDYHLNNDTETVTDNIPEDWESKRVKEVILNAKNGGTPKKSNEEYWGGNIDWLKSGEVRGKNTDTSKQSITKKALDETSAKIFEPDSILVAMYGGKGTVGRTTILRERMSGNQAICALRPDKSVISPEYLFYCFRQLRSKLENLARGAGQQNINQSIILKQEIPVPPLSKQTQIVDELERIDFSRIDQSTESLELLFDEYRESTLAHGFQGRLS